IVRSSFAEAGPEHVEACRPTPAEPVPPYYRPGAPLRWSVGRGYELRGTVRGTPTCKTIGNARIEFFLANPSGTYDTSHRGTIFTSQGGEYRIRSNFPGQFHALTPHIHLRASAPGFISVMTEY